MNVSLLQNQMSFRLSAYASQGAVPGGFRTEGAGQEGQKASRPGDYDTYECQTCKNRKYKDGSNDMGVSFKTPTRLSPERAAFAVRSHEMEHVSRARAKAAREDSEIVSQSVSYRTGVCPECGKTYLAGGTTKTVFRSAPETYDKEPAKKGAYVDLKV